jgi:hypothetical protein
LTRLNSGCSFRIVIFEGSCELDPCGREEGDVR